MADLQVTLALLLENEAEIGRAMAAAGGKAGQDFSQRLSEETRKALDELVSRADKAAREVGIRFSRQNLRFETVSGEIVPQQVLDRLGRLNKNFDEARVAAEAFAAATRRESQSATRSLNLLEAAVEGVAISLTSRLTDAAGTALASVRGLVSGFLELDGELRLAAAAAGEQGGYERLGKIVDQVGIEAAGTTKQVAELATSLVRAGFSVSEVEGALPGVVKGAEATGTSFQQFGNIVGNTLRGFGLEVDQTARVVDVLTNTANSSNASIEGLGYTFEYTAPIAKALGVSLEDVATAAGLMANAGIQGSVAGTGMRTFLQKLQQAAGGASPEVMGLVRGQERLAKVMRQLGAEVVGTNGKLLPMEQVLLRLKAGFDKLPEADKVQLSNVLFGDEASSKVLAMINQTGDAITKMSTDIRNSAGATNTARTAMAGMGLELQQLTGTIDSLKNNLGQVMASGLRPLVGVANTAVGVLSAMPGPVKATAGALITLGIASTGAAIGIEALNIVAARVAGMAGLRAAVAGATASIVGMGGTIAIILGGVAAVGLLTGQFKEMDATTKTLVQTTIAVGAGFLAFRAIGPILMVARAALVMFNRDLASTGFIAAFARGEITGGLKGALLSAGIAAATLAGTYFVMGQAIQVTGEDTAGLASKTRDLKKEMEDLDKTIAEGKRLGVNTSDAERQREIVRLMREEAERPLELKLDIQKGKAQLKELEEAQSKLPKTSARFAPGAAEIEAQKQYLKFLEQRDKKEAATGSGIMKAVAMSMAEAEKRINSLSELQLKLPIGATADRKKIEETKETLQKQLGLLKVRARIELGADAARVEFNRLMGDIAVAKNKGMDTTAMEAGLLPLRNSMRRFQLERVQNEKDWAATLDQTVEKEKARVATAQEQLAKQKAQLETQQAGLDVASKAAELDSNRLRLVQQVADAYASLANAQAGLAQSGFDVEKNRNSQRLSLAEKELQFLRDRGAAAGPIQAAEERIAAIKRDGEAIEFRAMQASIQAMTQRFEIERRVLDLKQQAERIDQQNAIRQAEIGVNRERQQLVKLKTDALAPGLTSDQKQSLAKQIELQNESVRLAMQLKQAEMDRLAVQPMIQAMQRAGQEAQQQTSSNQARGAAAAKGWEEAMSGFLGKADEAAGATNRLATEAKVFYGTLELNGKSIPIFDVVKQLPTPLGLLTETTQKMTDKIQEAVSQQKTLTDEVARTADAYAALNEKALAFMQNTGRLAAKPSARWAGGDVTPGNAYQVNELGTEAFLSRSGALSLISAPAFGTWSPPSAGMVLPAGLTARLEALGAFDGGMAPQLARGIAPAVPVSSGSSGRQVAALARLQRSIDRLEGTMRSYSPVVNVTLPGNAGLLHTLQSFR